MGRYDPITYGQLFHFPMTEQENSVLPRLLQIIVDIHAQTADFEQQQHDTQQWYDRGYADGMVKALRELGYEAQLSSLGPAVVAAATTVSPHLPWGQAYHHGMSMGERETHEVLGAPS